MFNAINELFYYSHRVRHVFLIRFAPQSAQKRLCGEPFKMVWGSFWDPFGRVLGSPWGVLNSLGWKLRQNYMPDTTGLVK